MPIERITYTKEDVVRRQIETAIDLFFSDADEVAMHTLVFAAHSITEDLCKHKGIKTEISAAHEVIPNQELSNRIHKATREAATYFKHANLDPEDTYSSFSPEFSWALLGITLNNYSRLGHACTAKMTAYYNWLLMWAVRDHSPQIPLSKEEDEKNALNQHTKAFTPLLPIIHTHKKNIGEFLTALIDGNQEQANKIFSALPLYTLDITLVPNNG